MISVPEAKRCIKEASKTSRIEVVPLLQANGNILSEPVYSLIDSPPFNQASMDGYAFSFQNWDQKSQLIVNREIQAGNFSSEDLKPLEAVRIFTGAALPSNADTVVMQEKVIKTGNNITINDSHLLKGSNVRLKGAQTQKGEQALPEGILLTPAGISFLAGLGLTDVKIFSKPSVNIIVTGKELTKAGQPISEGSIYESNSIGLLAALQQIQLNPNLIEVTDDDEPAIISAITRLIQADILIITGGVSVGDYDLVPSSLEKYGVKKIFHKVKQKPGKPMYFGTFGNTLVFGLPGNPAAVFCCFYEFIVPAISRFTKKEYFKKMTLPLTNDFIKKPGLTYFMKGKVSTDGVTILSNQESYQLISFALADCIITLEEEKEYFKKGDLVTIMMII